MKVYPESFLDKFFSSIDISKPFTTNEPFRAIQERALLLYRSVEIIPYIIAGIAIVTLIALYKKWKSQISLRLFSGILLLGGFVIWWYLAVFIEEIIRLFIIKNFVFIQYLADVPAPYIPLYAPLLAFPLVIYFLSRYAYACKGKIRPLVYASIGLQTLISFSATFWQLTLLANIKFDRINRVIYFETKSYTTMHIGTALLLYGSFIVLFYLLWNSLRSVARSNGILVTKFYTQLLKLVTFFLVIWIGIASYVNVHHVKDVLPLWTRYIELISPHLFYAIFAIYFMYALYRIKSIERVSEDFSKQVL